jgi:hypothetical protein
MFAKEESSGRHKRRMRAVKAASAGSRLGGLPAGALSRRDRPVSDMDPIILAMRASRREVRNASCAEQTYWSGVWHERIRSLQ